MQIHIWTTCHTSNAYWGVKFDKMDGYKNSFKVMMNLDYRLLDEM
jgi:hypothetical protein